MISQKFLTKISGLIDNYEDLDELNTYFKKRTGVLNFFESFQECEAFKHFLRSFQIKDMKSKDLGDFQTPIHLTDKICNYLTDIGYAPTTIIEPTCGKGNFIISALKFFKSLKYVYCIEVQKEYGWFFKLNLLQQSLEENINTIIELHRDNIFTHRFSDKFLQFLDTSPKHLLILGNPPWVTNTELSTINSANIPKKSNIKQYKGIEAITGRGNFDIAEYIIFQMVRQFSDKHGKIALLCKTSVIRNLVKDLQKLNLKLSNIKSLLINSKKEFNINAEGALFVADIDGNEEYFCEITLLKQPDNLIKKFGWTDGKFASDLELYKAFSYIDGKSTFIWRQGVKHDAAKVMVLTRIDSQMLNGFQETVSVESDLLYPFLKSSDLKPKVIKQTNKMVIITQSSLKENTDYIATDYPKLWNYLNSHSEYLDKRKSVIYKNRPRFSIFGIGDYAFKSYKVGISGFYKNPNFSLIFPIQNKPVILDDTSYYLYFNTFQDAFFTWLLLNHDVVQKFLSSIIFRDTKRPYTKEILMRIDLLKLAKTMEFNQIVGFYEKKMKNYIICSFAEKDYSSYLKKLSLTR